MHKKKINPLSRDLGDALLQRHRRVCGDFKGDADSVPEELIRKATVPYKELLSVVGAPESLAKGIGPYLYEVAEWCTIRGLPPINTLAINAKLGLPGVGYFAAPGASEKWNNDVRDCIACSQYPQRMTE